MRSLSLRKGVTFVAPRTSTQASQQITTLKTLPDIDWLDRDEGRRELRSIREDLAAGYATAVDDAEVTGYGAAARWARQ